MFTDLELEHDFTGFLAHTDGTVLMVFPYDDDRIGTSVADSELFSRQLSVASQGVFQERDPSDSIARIVAYHSIDEWPLIVSFSIPVEDGLAPFYRFALILVSIIALVLFVIVYAARYQIAQTIKLNEQTTTLQRTSDDLLTEITVRTRAELALKQYSENLEEKVDDRTHELREAQEALVLKEKLAVLGQLGGGVAHELRNPLGVISNAVYFLKSSLTEVDDTTEEYLDMISSEITVAIQIIENLLSLTRKEVPSMEMTPVAELVTRGFIRQVPPQGVRMSTIITDEMLSVLADPSQIVHVLENLFSNAYQAMPEGGELTLKAWEEDGNVLISVADSGSGIPEENLHEIFEPLFTTKARGIGLGLALSRDLISANLGSIEVESAVGKGSTFTLRLPGVS